MRTSFLSQRLEIAVLGLILSFASLAHATVTVSISPTSATVTTGQQQTFTATVGGTSNHGVTWSVDGVSGGNSSVGTISGSGLYTAPSSTGTHTVTATSLADSSKKASATVTVSASTLSIDFGSRSGATKAIPSGIIAAQLSYLANSVGFSLLNQANYREFRIDAVLHQVYTTQTADWTKLDPTVKLLQSNGFRPLIVMDYTPSWLQGTNYCPSGVPSVHNAPTDVNRWGQLAASVVAHMDQAFPGLVVNYEIWNEPDLSTGLCTSGNTNTARLNAYISMYAAAASAMKAQAAADNVQIKVGGPAIVSLGVASSWLPAFLSNSGSAPYIDFVSYHHYLAGDTDIKNGMGWDNTSGPTSLYSRVQNPNSGPAAWFTYIAGLVRSGSQPNAATTPIYITEYNDDWAFMNDCCRDSYAYSPLFNALYFADVMNTVFSGTNVPGKLVYFSSSAPSGAFCLVGNIDTAMDCAGNGTLPFAGYPQYYTYKLLAAGNYLNLNGGGYMPTSVTAPSPLVMTGFYTVTGDAIVIINPTPTSYSNVALAVNNPGSVSLNATQFLLNSSNTQIASSPLALTASGSGATATVTIPGYSVMALLLPTGVSAGGVSVKISPTSATLQPGQQQTFTATVTGATNTGVTWSVDGTLGGSSSSGTISNGVYTAPSTGGTHTVTATSVADPTRSASASVSVTSSTPITVTVTPSSVTLQPGQQQTFSATVTNATNTAVTWSVDGTVGGNSTAGWINTSGLYTAPSTTGAHTATATSAQDTTRSGSASVTVAVAAAGVTADFGSRSGSGFAVPPGLFGAQLGTYQDQTSLTMMKQASFGMVRIDAGLQNIFSTSSTPNWSATDALLTNLQTAGVKVMVAIDYTPAWLQPSPNPCANVSGTYYHAPPTDMAQWGQLAAAFVAHVNSNFPGLVTQYEIWNEPDSPGGLCVSDNTDATRRATYAAMFAAAASAMHAQSAAVLVGGPALGSPQGNAVNWIPALLSDSSAAPQVNFVTYHHFLGSASSISAGMNWDSSTATPPLLTRTQDPSTGAAALYKSVAAMVKKGLQPNAAATPIAITSFNSSNAWSLECCRNNTAFGPLFNSLFISDVLDTVYSGAQAVPGGLVYYSLSTPAGYFCLVGNIDANMDCAYTAGTAVPYPQSYAYQLIGSPNFLGLAGGGNMANSVSPTTLTAGLLATAFYTSANDAVVVVNPTSSAVNNVTVSLQNLGYASPTATMYLLNSANGQITSQPLSLNLVGSGATAAITVPAYSTVGISVHP